MADDPTIPQASEEFNPSESLDVLSGAINGFTAFINTLNDEDCEVVLIGDWSLKDILSHFVGWNNLTIFDLYCTLRQEPEKIIWIDEAGIDAFNAKKVAERSGYSFSAVYLDFIRTSEKLLKLYQSLTKEQWQLEMVPGFTIATSLQTDIVHFRDAHLPEIITAITARRRLSASEQ